MFSFFIPFYAFLSLLRLCLWFINYLELFPRVYIFSYYLCFCCLMCFPFWLENTFFKVSTILNLLTFFTTHSVIYFGICSMECVFCYWVEWLIHAGLILLSDDVDDFFTFLLIFPLVVLLILEMEVLKSLHNTVNLSIFPFISWNLALHIFQLCHLLHTYLELLFLLVRPLFHHCKMFLSVSEIFFILRFILTLL